ncbi:cobalt transporter CbiM [Anaeromicrobium sediminis]|uniref:Cobalamin biosynthesis protein CbiM n=1 Tax=Anaeromicrobium sediminis TaxID=1478221 RepID=A0A267MJX2_9FIRM|nr:cobalt transporter CbiM [Anaeromicrobium sediminis]PAB59080.1 cobalamin biosynthesis protein CbiM [Anaeromicrobium sediminis]
MHIPDNYLSPSTCATLGVTMIPIWKWASTKVKKEMSRQKMPLLGICTAFVFLIMMFNIPLPGGTTGHAVGATLAAILLGPYSAVIAVTIALAIQALFFGDGGILALGVNCFNMAFIMPFVAFYIFKFVKENFPSERGQYVGAFLAGYISLNVAALLTAIEFGIQPMLFTDNVGLPLYSPYGLNIAIPAMMIPHLLVAGILEGLVTAGVYAYVKKLSPEIIYKGTSKKIKPLYALIVSLVILSPLGVLATGTAWGEWAPEELKEFIGFIPKGMIEGFNFSAPIPDYAISGVSEIIAYIFSALVGVGLIFTLIKLLSKSQFKNNPEKVK